MKQITAPLTEDSFMWLADAFLEAAARSAGNRAEYELQVNWIIEEYNLMGDRIVAMLEEQKAVELLVNDFVGNKISLEQLIIDFEKVTAVRNKGNE